MEQYYYSKNNQKLGPFSFDELKTKPMQKNTLVWKNGMRDWVTAENIPELNDIVSSPPTISSDKSTNSNKKEISKNSIIGTVREFNERTEVYTRKTQQGTKSYSTTIWDFRIERFDEQNDKLPMIQVEMRGSILYGRLDNGNKVEIIDPENKNGVLLPKKIYNYTTNSMIQQGKGCFGALVLLFVSAFSVSYFLYYLIKSI